MAHARARSQALHYLGPDEQAECPTLAEATTHYLAEMRDTGARGRPCNEATLAAYQQRLELLARWLRHQHGIAAVGAISRQHLKDFLRHYRHQTWRKDDQGEWALAPRPAEAALASRRMVVQVLRSFFDYLVREEVLAENPAAHLQPPRGRGKEPHALTDEEVRALLRAPDSSGKRGQRRFADLRDYTLMCLLLGTGLRITEALSLRVADLPTRDTIKGSLRMQAGPVVLDITGKGQKRRQVPLDRGTRKALDKYLPLRHDYLRAGFDDPCDWLFPSCRNTPLSRGGFAHQLKRYAQQAGIKPQRVHAHAFRHTFGRNAQRIGMSPYLQARIMGHATLTMVMHYQHLAQSQLEEVSLKDDLLRFFEPPHSQKEAGRRAYTF